MRIRPPAKLRVTTVAAVLALVGSAATAASAGLLEVSATTLRGDAARPVAAARAGGTLETLRAALAARGRDAGSLAALRATNAHAARTGLQHVMFEQTIDGLSIHGAYVKATYDRRGNLVHVIDASVRVPAASALVAARVGPAAALRAAMVRLHPAARATFRDLGTSGQVTRFDGGAFFGSAPTVTAVAVPMRDGTLARGWVVETWTARTNQLHYTLVGGDGSVLAVESRTHDDAYNVFAVDPGKGPQTVVNGPAPGTSAESPAGWLSGGAESTALITGNNVAAYLDADANNGPDVGVGTWTSSGTFVSGADLAQQPNVGDNRLVAVQNLFYLNNRVHDILYSHGFTESAGNFQMDNFGKGGVGGDAVKAEAQDGGGLSNANFSTPQDGFRPRMQMYLWQNHPTLELKITSPISASYDASGAQFGAALPAGGVGGAISATTPADGCTAIGTALAGKVALIDRGTCNFSLKALNAQNAGAIGVVVANNQGGDALLTMAAGDGADQVTIPAIMISQNSGAALKALASPTGTMQNKTVMPLMRDGSLDSDVVYHEYGHGLTHRMIGNKLFAMSGPLAGAIGEGASDTVAMLINGDDVVGEYSSESPSGIRRFPYAGYPLTYGDVTGAEVHNDGEIYAAIMWRLIELFGPARRDVLFDYFVDGMNYTRIQPKFEDMRDGMLESIAQSGTPADRCTIWSAFAQFGVGVGASGVVNGDFSVTITPSFTKPADCN